MDIIPFTVTEDNVDIKVLTKRVIPAGYMLNFHLNHWGVPLAIGFGGSDSFFDYSEIQRFIKEGAVDYANNSHMQAIVSQNSETSKGIKRYNLSWDFADLVVLTDIPDNGVLLTFNAKASEMGAGWVWGSGIAYKLS